MTLESLLLVPLLDYRTQADRHGIRVEVTVKVPEEVFDRLCAEVGETTTRNTVEVTIGGVRFETERT